ncbi:hypothetical protein [Dyella sp.]|uniref:hypothetical protein n=1 Tax=Dyella sp. TaxID=1869338 RepID=UPI002FDA4EA3
MLPALKPNAKHFFYVSLMVKRPSIVFAEHMLDGVFGGVPAFARTMRDAVADFLGPMPDAMARFFGAMADRLGDMRGSVSDIARTVCSGMPNITRAVADGMSGVFGILLDGLGGSVAEKHDARACKKNCIDRFAVHAMTPRSVIKHPHAWRRHPNLLSGWPR